jgi:anti-anti-sigma factor
MVTAEDAGRIIILEPHDRLTAETADRFTRAVAKRLAGGCRDLILDLQYIRYLDGAGVGALAHAYTSSRRCGGRLVLVHVFGKNRELLRITRLLTVFQVYETTIEAQRSFARPTEQGSPGLQASHLPAQPQLRRGPLALDGRR